MGSDGMSDVAAQLWWDGGSSTQACKHGADEVFPTACSAYSYADTTAWHKYSAWVTGSQKEICNYLQLAILLLKYVIPKIIMIGNTHHHSLFMQYSLDIHSICPTYSLFISPNHFSIYLTPALRSGKILDLKKLQLPPNICTCALSTIKFVLLYRILPILLSK